MLFRSVPPAASFDLAGDFQTQADWVYWSSPYAVGRVHRDGTTPTQVTRLTTFSGMAVASSGLVYYFERSAAGNYAMNRADLTALSSGIVNFGPFFNPSVLAINTSNVYWSEPSGVIKRTPLVLGGGIVPLRAAVAGGYEVRSIVLDATNIYWIESTSAGVEIGRAHV